MLKQSDGGYRDQTEPGSSTPGGITRLSCLPHASVHQRRASLPCTAVLGAAADMGETTIPGLPPLVLIGGSSPIIKSCAEKECGCIFEYGSQGSFKAAADRKNHQLCLHSTSNAANRGLHICGCLFLQFILEQSFGTFVFVPITCKHVSGYAGFCWNFTEMMFTG